MLGLFAERTLLTNVGAFHEGERPLLKNFTENQGIIEKTSPMSG
jgi:hypothetical protein